MPSGRIEYYLNSGAIYTLRFNDDSYEFAKKLFDDYKQRGFESWVTANTTTLINMRCVEKVIFIEDK
jgi:hypothetical protein